MLYKLSHHKKPLIKNTSSSRRLCVCGRNFKHRVCTGVKNDCPPGPIPCWHILVETFQCADTHTHTNTLMREKHTPTENTPLLTKRGHILYWLFSWLFHGEERTLKNYRMLFCTSKCRWCCHYWSPLPTNLEDAADINIISPTAVLISIGNNNVQDILEDQDNHRPFKVK